MVRLHVLSQRGDLLVYYPNMDDPKWRYGHVAVVVDVDLDLDLDLDKGTVSLAEENYNNLVWDNPEKFARQIRLFNIGGHYRLLDIGMTDNKNINGGLGISCFENLISANNSFQQGRKSRRRFIYAC